MIVQVSKYLLYDSTLKLYLIFFSTLLSALTSRSYHFNNFKNYSATTCYLSSVSPLLPFQLFVKPLNEACQLVWKSQRIFTGPKAKDFDEADHYPIRSNRYRYFKMSTFESDQAALMSSLSPAKCSNIRDTIFPIDLVLTV